ncbi:unnamed protein product [Amoebophrya sp. A25]|nr:unnamed protein product [Amoebophrya sp. A25]|eukprot:GSA25T00026137001.1
MAAAARVVDEPAVRQPAHLPVEGNRGKQGPALQKVTKNPRRGTSGTSAPETITTSSAKEPHYLKIFFVLVLFRAINGALLATAFAPDEQWQSLEIAHLVVFGKGHFTWEWDPTCHALRSWLHPMLFVVYYGFLQATGLSDLSPWLVAYGPRVFVQSWFVAGTDWCVWRIARTVYQGKRSSSTEQGGGKNQNDKDDDDTDISYADEDAEDTDALSRSDYVLLVSLFSWFNFFAGPRTYSSGVEAFLNAFGVYLLQVRGCAKSAVFVGSIACVLRPTAALFWGIYFPVTYFTVFARSRSGAAMRLASDFFVYLSIFATTALVLGVGVDTLGYNVLARSTGAPAGGDSCSSSISASIGIDTSLVDFFSAAMTICEKYFHPVVAQRISDVFASGRLYFSGANFLRFNLFQDGGKFYGSQPTHWYFLDGLGGVLLSYFPLAFYGFCRLFPATTSGREDHTDVVEISEDEEDEDNCNYEDKDNENSLAEGAKASTKAGDDAGAAQYLRSRRRNKQEIKAAASVEQETKSTSTAVTKRRRMKIRVLAESQQSLVRRRLRPLLLALVGTVFGLTLASSHKEHRFLLPVLWICYLPVAEGISALWEKSRRLRPCRTCFFFVFMLQFFALLFFSFVHQRGGDKTTEWLREELLRLGAEAAQGGSKSIRKIPVTSQFANDECRGVDAATRGGPLQNRNLMSESSRRKCNVTDVFRHDGREAKRLNVTKHDVEVDNVHINNENDDNEVIRPSIFFATPCHAMPLYSYLHVGSSPTTDFDAAFLDCSPGQAFAPWRDRFRDNPVETLDQLFVTSGGQRSTLEKSWIPAENFCPATSPSSHNKGAIITVNSNMQPHEQVVTTIANYSAQTSSNSFPYGRLPTFLVFHSTVFERSAVQESAVLQWLQRQGYTLRKTVFDSVFGEGFYGFHKGLIRYYIFSLIPDTDGHQHLPLVRKWGPSF